jgi:fatty acid desaturase
MQKRREEDVWKVHGQFYDFSSFHHPGGQTLLMLGRGRDCTELWESVHQFAGNPEVFRFIFEKYNVEMPGLPCSEEFNWSPDEAKFTYELRRRARHYFTKNNLDRKADFFYFSFFSLYAFVMVICYAYMLTHRSFLFSTISGLMMSFYGPAVMHTASHYAISSSPFINWMCFASCCNLIGWFHHLWLQHHVWGHHSYTGIPSKDPDVESMPKYICRKNERFPWRPQHRFNVLIEVLIMLVFPSQTLAQMQAYFTSIWKGTVFGMKVFQFLSIEDTIATIFQTTIFISCFILLPIRSTGIGHLLYVFWSYLVFSFLYWAYVSPNHEVFEVNEQTKKPISSGDWSIEQIRHSANFQVPYWMSFMIGGMNYQIEHHLFPTVHPRHFPALSKIVREMCHEYQVPYVSHDSWLSALWSHFRFMNHLSRRTKAATSNEKQ